MKQKNQIGPDTIVFQKKGLISSDMDGETVLLSVESGQYFGMDLIGSRIWELVAEPRTVSRLCEALLEEYEVDREQCQRDVIAYLNHLVEEGLLELSDGAPS